MCNLGESLVAELTEELAEKFLTKGSAEGRERTAINLLRRLMRHGQGITSQSIAEIAEDTEITVERVKELAKDNGLALA